MPEAKTSLSSEEVIPGTTALGQLCVMAPSLSLTLSFCLSRQGPGHTTTLGLSGLGTVFLSELLLRLTNILESSARTTVTLRSRRISGMACISYHPNDPWIDVDRLQIRESTVFPRRISWLMKMESSPA